DAKFFFPRLDLGGPEDLDLHCLVAWAFEDRHACQNRRSLEDAARDGADHVLVAQAHCRRMDSARTGVFAETDRDHPQNTAADTGGKVRVWLPPVNHHNTVSGERRSTEVNLHAVTGPAKPFDLH